MPGVFKCIDNGILCNLVENDSSRFLLIQSKFLEEVPGNGLPFAVLISGQPNHLRFFCQVLQFFNQLFLIGRDYVVRGKLLFDVNSQVFLCQIPDMPET